MTRQARPLARTLCALPVLALLLALGAAPSLAQGPTEGLWSDVSERAALSGAERLIVPDAYRTVWLDRAGMAGALAAAPLEAVPFDTRDGVLLALPTPAGGFATFRVIEAPVMAPELQARYPEIRSYYGRAVDHPGTVARISMTPDGFRALVLGEETFLIDPLQRGDAVHHMVYARADYTPDPERVFEAFHDEHVIDDGTVAPPRRTAEAQRQNGALLRTYRTAIAATGEYTAFHGGTVAAGLAAINVTMTRVNGVYERDFSVRMVLVANNNVIVYTDAATDPYSNFNGGLMLGQNQANLDAVIGTANYDIGHVFSTGGGGVAGLGVVCRAGLKARGVTGLSSPTNDVFHIDYVAHEIGHQFRANHSFNGNAGACSGGNRNASTAYEPGSGSTIMAYAGICGTHNLQANSHDYFHTISLDEVVDYITTGFGSTCGTATATGNAPPVVTSPHGGLTIPVNTPFFLRGSATDDGPAASLRYAWEQFNLGPAGPPPGVGAWAGTAPHFRSLPPVAEPVRYFPAFPRVLANQPPAVGEGYPLAGQSLAFRLTARDNAGGIGDTQISIAVDAVAGPFVVTYPNAAGLAFDAGSPLEITWNVAGTDANNVNAAFVDILYSGNNGGSFPTVLAAATPNTGSATVTLPNTPTGGAALGRIMIVGTNHIFYDVNDHPFTLNVRANQPPVAVDDAYTTPRDTPLAVAAPGVLANDTDPDGDALTAVLGTGPASGALVLNADGSFLYTPNAGFTGEDTFTYRASDGPAQSNLATVTITVTPPADTTPPECGPITLERVNGLMTAIVSSASDDGSGIASVFFTTTRNVSGFAGPTGGALQGPFAQGATATFDPASTPSVALRAERTNLTAGGAFVVRVTNGVGLSSNCDPVVSQLSATAPEAFALEAPYPNPARTGEPVRLAFSVAEASEVRVAVYDVAGREVARLVDGAMEAGRYEVAWSGADGASGHLAAGVYVVRMEAGPFRQTLRVTVVH